MVAPGWQDSSRDDLYTAGRAVESDTLQGGGQLHRNRCGCSEQVRDERLYCQKVRQEDARGNGIHMDLQTEERARDVTMRWPKLELHQSQLEDGLHDWSLTLLARWNSGA